MKNKRWLFVLVGILFLINISFFIIIRYTRYDRLLSDQIVSLIDEQMNTKTSIASLAVSDRQLHLSGIKIEDANETFIVHISDLYLNYNLFNVIFSDLKLFRAIESVSIIEPRITVHIEKIAGIDPAASEQGFSELPQIPDISDYFEILNIVRGSLELNYSDPHLTYRDVFSDFDLQIVNSQTTTSILNLRRKRESVESSQNAKTIKTGENEKAKQEKEIGKETNIPHIQGADYRNVPNDHTPLPPVIIVKMETERDELLSLNTFFHDYTPEEFTITGLQELDFLLNLQGVYDGHDLRLHGLIHDLNADYEEKEILAEGMDFFSINDRLFFHSDNLLLDGNQALLDIELRDILSEPDLRLTMQAENIPLARYLPVLKGSADLEVKLKGSPFKPSASFRANSGEIDILGEEVSDLLLTAEYAERHAVIELQKANWQDNHITGTGSYSPEQGFFFNIEEDDLVFDFHDYTVNTDLAAELSYRKEFACHTTLKGLHIDNRYLSLKDLQLSADLIDQSIHAKLKGDRFALSAEGHIQDKRFTSEVDLQGLGLNDIIKQRTGLLRSYPHLTGKIKLSYEDDILDAHTGFRMYNQLYGELEGDLQANVSVDFLNNSSSFSLRTDNTTYLYEPFSIDLKATGTTESLTSEEFFINEELQAGFSLRTDPEFNFDFSIRGEQLNLSKYLAYFMQPYTARQFTGNIDLDVEILYPERITGSVNGKDLSYKKIGSFNNQLDFSLTNTLQDTGLINENLQFKNTLKSLENKPLVSLSGNTQLNSSLDTDILVTADSLSLQELAPESDLQGLVNSELYLKRISGKNEFGITLEAFNCSYGWLQDHENKSSAYSRLMIDTLIVDAVQKDNMLHIDRFYAGKRDLFTARAEGNLGYNIITNRMITADDQIDLSFRGDLLKTLADYFSFIESGSSDTEIDLHFGIREDELAVMEGKLLLNDGRLRITGQPQRVEKINIDFLFENNRMIINRFENRIGDSSLFLRNEIRDNEEDFMLGMLNLGHFFARTSSKGILLHIPSYFPHNTTGTIVIKGRDADEAVIKGPFDDIRIIADLHLSNTSVTYPSDTENLFKLINVATEKRSDSVSEPLPFELDLKLIAGHQTRYVTYPLNALLLNNSYLHLLYQDNEWIPADAFFASESGSLDMFGTTFNLDYADFYINYELNDYRLKGVFFKYASDGSLITLDIFNEHDGRSAAIFENMQFQLKSDNPEDRTTLHVLSKLRYNRRLEDIPRSQQSSLMQDEFLHLAGMGITGAIVDPFISPFINRTRHLLRLDFFSIKPSLVENLVRTYGFNEHSREPEEENEIIQFGKNILLNNLAITMGKFIARDLYLDYEFLLQKPVDVIRESDLLVYQNFTFHYNLPYRLRLAYRFYLKPEGEKNSHEIFVRRSFTFW